MLQVAIKSLETVIQRFLELAQQKTEEAQKTSIEKVEEIDDLDQADAPEKYVFFRVDLIHDFRSFRIFE